MQAQSSIENNKGIITGTVLDAENNHSLQGVKVELIRMDSLLNFREALTSRDGAFLFEELPFGYYRIKFSFSGLASLLMDSIYLRPERYDFDLNEIKLSAESRALQEVLIYVEKPLIENRDGKIIFNVGESALSAGASTTELLKQTPLLSLDADGKVLMKGKDVKILIDDKPVELNAKQLQDLLESMPGSMIDKIEVMTTPPPQYANERGGVINIITKKGKVGKSARINLNYGTRGEAGINAHFSYRKNKLAINANGGFGYNEYEGNSNSERQNIYRDSVNFFTTNSFNNNLNRRPNARLSVDYDLDKRNSVNFTGQFNANNSEYNNATGYTNLDRNSQAYRLSSRDVANFTRSSNPFFNITFTSKNKDASRVLKIISGYNFSHSSIDKDFFQQYLDPSSQALLSDSTQFQELENKAKTFNLRVNYDKELVKDKWNLNTGGFYTSTRNHNILSTSFLKKPEMIAVENKLLSNDFIYSQDIASARLAIRYNFQKDFYINAGLQLEHSITNFDIREKSGDFRNDYWSTLPFVNLIRKWPNDLNLTFSYKRTVQRPGLNEMNPNIDYSDPYNTRFGNPFLLPYYADNFDLTFGRWTKLYNLNFGMGYNQLNGIFSSLRTLLPDGKTEVTWQNISGRKEYEASAWGGYTISKKSKANLSFGYTYNTYSLHDRVVRKFRNGGSFYTTLNSSYQFSPVFSMSGSFTFNRFANPQGTVRNALSMNVGLQKKFLDKKLTISLNAIDPFKQALNRTETFGTNFILESYNSTKTRNFRIAAGYLFSKKIKKPVSKSIKSIK